MAALNNPGGYWLCVGDGDEVEARIGPTPLEWFPDYEAALRECVERNQAAIRKDAIWPPSYSVRAANSEVAEEGARLH